MRFTPSDGSVSKHIQDACDTYKWIARGDDAVQEAHLHVYGLLRRGLDFEHEEHFRSWVFRSVRNALLNMTYDARMGRLEVREDPYDATAHPHCEGRGEAQVMGRAVQDALERMPDELRPYAEGYAMADGRKGGWGCTELANTLGESRETTRDRVERAFDWLRWELIDD